MDLSIEKRFAPRGADSSPIASYRNEPPRGILEAPTRERWSHDADLPGRRFRSGPVPSPFLRPEAVTNTATSIRRATTAVVVSLVFTSTWLTASPAGAAGGRGSAGSSGDAGVSGPPAKAAQPLGSLPGIDVSHWQGTIDWAQVAASGQRFAIAM